MAFDHKSRDFIKVAILVDMNYYHQHYWMIIAKVLIEMLKTIMGELVSKHQNTIILFYLARDPNSTISQNRNGTTGALCLEEICMIEILIT
ncbi:hypothetical protein H5410_021321 [Solanum commersonii]|uniref:Uncharacterized protein n=1 Tax=Solanum commersonii TaxID=4109 RepID=A0A9J5ZDX3_SOLCO|nr:hypothetical protein H5410_021321 [Solanum commersonii]